MDYRLLATGFSLLIASVLLSAYGYLTGDGGILGIGFSTMTVSAVLTVLAYEPNLQTREVLANYTTILSKALAGVLEDLDLLPPRIRVIQVGDRPLLVISKGAAEPVNPGIGVIEGVPYLAFPLEESESDVLDLGTAGNEQVELCVERILGEAVEASDIGVRISRNIVRISIYGVSDIMDRLFNYPINPLIIAALGAISRCLKKNLTLGDYSRSGRDHHLVIEVEGYVD